MWNRLNYYARLAWNDLFRFRSSAFLQALIVAGVCFPVLILLSLKRGHVEDLREELVKSPTGRLVKIYPAAAGHPFTLAELDSLASSLGNVEMAIPNVRRIVDLSSTIQNRESLTVEDVDIYATVPGDPILRAQDADVIKKSENAIVLYDSISKVLDVDEGDKILLKITRSRSEETGVLELLVKKIIPSSSDDKIGFVDSELINCFTKFIRGGGIPEWDWPSSSNPPIERYPSFLLINDATDPLKPDDFLSLKIRNFNIEKVTTQEELSLGGALPEEHRNQVIIYRLTRQNSAGTISNRMTDKLEAIGRSTLATDAAIPWCSPREEIIDGKKMKLVGLTLPPRCKWLHNLLLSPDIGFEVTSESEQCQFSPHLAVTNSISKLTIDDKASISLQATSFTQSVPQKSTPVDSDVMPPDTIKSDSKDPRPKIISKDTDNSDDSQKEIVKKVVSSTPEIIFVPAKLLASIDEYRAGTAIYDSQLGQMASIVTEPTYEDALVFASTIDDVPEIVANAVKQNIPFNAENARIEEIQKQDGSLQKLVVIVGLLVFSFGILTVFGVLWESTARKRNIIGIMRVMGVTPTGAFLIILIRALILGVLAACLTLVAGYLCVLLLAWIPPEQGQLNEWLHWKPVISAQINQQDLYLVVAGSIFCCIVGSIAPAFSASRLDPFDALVQGRYR